MKDDHAAARREMVARQLRARGIRDERVLEVMGRLPRHLFVPPDKVDAAYEDRPLPIGLNQTISQPYMVAAMTEALNVLPHHRVLEIGSGSGYQTAVLSALAEKVYTVERHEELAKRARACLDALGCDNVKVIVGDGTLGWPAAAPYDRILVTAGAPDPPKALVAQLAPGGEMLCPAGSQERQQLVRIRQTDGGLRRQAGMDCIFVPLIGAEGWQEPD